ncbi:MAG: AmmeMemoRadiSam system protein B [Ignavibacteria bacterium]|jgi:AmmeMemoRadiSam system protein B/AmmeMemoRadiSam system protein A
MKISQKEKKIILDLARNSISSIFNKGKKITENFDDIEILTSKCGAFVTLTINGNLRGCIGYITSGNPLHETIKDAAVQAALNDPRFSPLTEKEVDKIEIEVSILSEPFPMKNYDEIEIGKHGLILEEMGSRALLLPQVPVEHNMDKDDFLSALCQKGGFKPSLWKERTLNINLFTADVFSEKELEEEMELVRKPSVAGMFYPASKSKLETEIQLMFDSTVLDFNPENIFGIISPHAGYVYSGKTAAYAYKTLIEKKINTALIISPSHREYFPGICVYEGDGYETPFGKIPVDKDLRERFLNHDRIIFSGSQGHKTEHALEVQIPFIQFLFNDIKILPVVMGEQNREFINTLAERIAETIDENTIVIASSDLSHFYNKSQADNLDSVIEKRINNFEFEELQKDFEERKCEACGAGPMVALLKAASLKGYNKAKVLARTNSGDITGDTSEVVGYLSAVIYK